MNNKAQRDKIASYIREHGSMDTIQARGIGIMHPAARVMELKEGGLNIVTNLMQVLDSCGVKHPKVAVYTLDKSLC
ncbi:MAG: helix-turn-helix domain-containing protein [Ghiorsea sp.]